MMDKKQILLRAAYDILTKCENSHYVQDTAAVRIFYDGADCDGTCLREEIAEELGISVNEKPLEENTNV